MIQFQQQWPEMTWPQQWCYFASVHGCEPHSCEVVRLKHWRIANIWKFLDWSEGNRFFSIVTIIGAVLIKLHVNYSFQARWVQCGFCSRLVEKVQYNIFVIICTRVHVYWHCLPVGVCWPYSRNGAHTGRPSSVQIGFVFEPRGMAAVRLRNEQMLMFFKTSLSVLVLVFNPCTDKMVDTAWSKGY
jgi:hypothetical protein